MPITVDQAKDVLKSVSDVERTSIRAHRYRTGSMHLIVWGAVWALGYGLSYIEPRWSYVWPVLVAIGFGVSLLVGRRSGERAGYDWRPGATAAAAALFVVAVFTVLPPSADLQVGAIIPLLVALFYAVLGIWMRAVRFVTVGIAVALLTLCGYFYLREFFPLWMAIVGGGALVVGGFWLRTVP